MRNNISLKSLKLNITLLKMHFLNKIQLIYNKVQQGANIVIFCKKLLSLVPCRESLRIPVRIENMNVSRIRKIIIDSYRGR